MFERIALHKTMWNNRKVIISTVKISGAYETMVMYDDGEEIEYFHTQTEEEARKKHNETMTRWNDKVYENSVAKLLAFENVGQCVKTVVPC